MTVMDLQRRWQYWPYKNTTWLIIGLVVFFLLAGTPSVEAALRLVGGMGYIGALVAGLFSVSIFTVAPAAIVLLYLAEGSHPWLVAVVAGVGAMMGDYIIFRYLRDRVFEEIQPLWQRSLPGTLTGRLFATPYFSWLVPILGMVVIASPLPDEVGVGMLGASRLRSWQFLIVTFILNVLGIAAVTLLGVA